MAVAGVLAVLAACADRSARPVGQAEGLPWERLRIERLEQQVRGEARTDEAVLEQQRVFEDAASWQGFWAGYHADGIPDVDFGSRRAVVVSLGAKGPGWAVSVDAVTYDPARRQTTVHLLEQHPSPARPYAGVTTYPADAAVFPAEPGDVVFVRASTIDAE